MQDSRYSSDEVEYYTGASVEPISFGEIADDDYEDEEEEDEREAREPSLTRLGGVKDDGFKTRGQRRRDKMNNPHKYKKKNRKQKRRKNMA